MSKLLPLILKKKKGREREGSPKLQKLSACRWILEDGTSQEPASRPTWLGHGVQVRGKAWMTAGAQIPKDKDCPCNKECEHRNKRLWKIFLKEHEEGWFAEKFWLGGHHFYILHSFTTTFTEIPRGHLATGLLLWWWKQQPHQTDHRGYCKHEVRWWFVKLHSIPFIRTLGSKFSLASVSRTAMFLLHNVSFLSYDNVESLPLLQGTKILQT